MPGLTRSIAKSLRILALHEKIHQLSLASFFINIYLEILAWIYYFKSLDMRSVWLKNFTFNTVSVLVYPGILKNLPHCLQNCLKDFRRKSPFNSTWPHLTVTTIMKIEVNLVTLMTGLRNFIQLFLSSKINALSSKNLNFKWQNKMFCKSKAKTSLKIFSWTSKN